MKVTRRSPIDGVERTVDLDITQEQVDRHARGGLIQNVMGHLSLDEREFYMTGITPAQWDEHIVVDEED